MIVMERLIAGIAIAQSLPVVNVYLNSIFARAIANAALVAVKMMHVVDCFSLCCLESTKIVVTDRAVPVLFY
ncbi:MAG: hypothetical protein D3923_16745 [Candidatus Electrothrix sp. AR3]|nr:hypothetical protein [Candidatus Electrothrix sp. AR3]